jgi:nitroreductase
MTQWETAPGADAVLEDLLTGRWSCRAFEHREVPRDVIKRVLALAQRSPSWCNTQPWGVIVTSGQGTERFRSALAAHARSADFGSRPDFPMPDGYYGIYRDRRRECGWQLYDAVGVARGDRAASARQAFKNFELFGAPHAAIITTDTGHNVYGAVDAGLYVGSFLLAAQGLGLGAIPQAAIARCSPFVRDFFGIPDDRRVLLGISFGYPDRDDPANSFRTNRAPLSEAAQWVDQ